MNSFHARELIFFLVTCSSVQNVVGMDFLAQCLYAVCGSRCLPSSQSLPEQESNHNRLPVHNPHDVGRLLYDVLDPMPMDLINIIMEYDAYQLKGKLLLNHEINGWVDCLVQLNDEIIVLGLHDGTIMFVSIKTGKIIKTIKAHTAPIFDLGALLDGRLFSVSADKLVKYWDMRKKFACVQHKALVTDDEKTVVTEPSMTCVARDLIESRLFSGQIRLCDPQTGALQCKIMVPPDATDVVEYSERDLNHLTMLTPVAHDGLTHELQYTQGAIVASDASARAILATIEAESKKSISKHTDYDVEQVREIKLYDEDGAKTVTGAIPIRSCKWLIRLSKDFWVSDNTADSHEIRLWNCKTGHCVTFLKVDKPIRAMAPLHNGMIAVGLSDTNTRIIDPKTTITMSILNHGAYIKGLEVLNDGTLASFGSGGVKLWR